MDFTIFEAVNDWSAAHGGFVHGLAVLDNALTVVIVLATLALWFWGLRAAAVGALAAGALAFALNQVVHALWDRPRPYESHPGVWHPYASSTDASFPSDHTSAAFGIAWLVFLWDRTVGAAFLVLAGALAWIRVVVGFHYPGDVLAGALIGLVAAVLLRRLAGPFLERRVAGA